MSRYLISKAAVYQVWATIVYPKITFFLHFYEFYRKYESLTKENFWKQWKMFLQELNSLDINDFVKLLIVCYLFDIIESSCVPLADFCSASSFIICAFGLSVINIYYLTNIILTLKVKILEMKQIKFCCFK